MSTLQQQARALGDPTRHDIFRYLADAARPVDVPELTEHFGLNHNAIRQHLAKLVGADLVVEQTAPSSGRGRPRLRYALHPATDSRWGVMGPYERLTLLLSEIVRSGDTPVEVGRRAGRRLPLGAAGAAGPVAELADQMARQGFDPVVSRKGDAVEVVLRTCPFATTALADPGTVCELHLGMAFGIAEAVGGLVVDELEPKDPRRAHCRLRCRVEAPGPPAA
ncbi:MAG: helix-turn-helix domain-containing protein [Acidimicrobiia bacterium]|nr:helix-turn-helix domain-containing protein [Acidimicrobiia bacterium]